MASHQRRREFVRYDLRPGQFTIELAGVSRTELDFSKDEKWVAYISVPEKSLFRSADDESQRLPLTRPPLAASLPHWSPDGKQIAFMGASAGSLGGST
jgi:Tol biopolymer transport system component